MIMMIIMSILSEANENANFADEIKWKCGCHNLSLDIAYNCINDCDFVNSIDINYGADSRLGFPCSNLEIFLQVSWTKYEEVVGDEGTHDLAHGGDDEASRFGYANWEFSN
ncbi:hypothetical protein V8G54_017060 [Vigna mungo]|uniref:Uncharacterized protein n=1 Tax=Vigna mungo TaxID=3915 RepID=A0AAQ3NMK7_VIGMU